MNVELKHWSQGPDFNNLEELIAYVARVSNPQNQNNVLTASNLISYLERNKHWSPFEMCSICLELETTRDIARQLLRHRSLFFQEFSQRYQKVGSQGFELREARLQDNKNRQNSIETEDSVLQTAWNYKQTILLDEVKDVYQWALDNGIAKEQARAVLPEGLTGSRLYAHGTVRSWMHYIQIRTEKATQKEHRELALSCALAIEPIFPSIMKFVSLESNT